MHTKSMKIPTALIADEHYTHHLTGPFHPEKPERVTAIIRQLEQNFLLNRNNLFSPRMATEQEVLYCHTKEYLEKVKVDIQKCIERNETLGTYTLSTGDVQISPESLTTALLAVGGSLVGIDCVMENRAKNAFCIVRPPGHHATASQGMGFCIFNNVAIAARYAQRKYAVRNIVIIDWDVHHGNGTQAIFYSDPSVFYFSTHQYPFYPGTGAENEKGYGAGMDTTLNCPIAAGPFSRSEVLRAFRHKLVPAMENFKPELVLISAGFDAHEADPLGGFTLSTEDYAVLTEIVMSIANHYCNGKIVSILEGGYDLKALADSAALHVKTLNTES